MQNRAEKQGNPKNAKECYECQVLSAVSGLGLRA